MSFALEFEYTDNFDFEGLNPMEMREICNERRDVVVLADELLQKWITYINRVSCGDECVHLTPDQV